MPMKLSYAAGMTILIVIVFRPNCEAMMRVLRQGMFKQILARAHFADKAGMSRAKEPLSLC